MIGSLSQAHRIREQLLNRQSGKWLLSQDNPNEFEYYMVAFELLKSDLSTSKYFVFPVNPTSIEFNDTALTKVTKTAGGVSVMKNSQFNIKDISLSGNFGKSFKVLIGSDFRDLHSAFKDQNGIGDKVKTAGKGILDSFSSSVKTGYGCTKILEDILDQSNQKDEYGGSHFLIFYNLAFNQKYFVEFESKTFTQNVESNMIWNYNIRLNVVANSDDFLTDKADLKSTKQLVVDKEIQQNANTVYSKVSNVLNKKYNSIFF